jgi:hypothetical protein
MDCATGAQVLQNGVNVPSGDRTFTIPASLGNEVVLELERASSPTGATDPLPPSSFGAIKSRYH